jgi:hypothetical protein
VKETKSVSEPVVEKQPVVVVNDPVTIKTEQSNEPKITTINEARAILNPIQDITATIINAPV